MDEKYGMTDEAPRVLEESNGIVIYDEDLQDETDMDAEERLSKIKGWEAFRERWLAYYQKKIDEVNDRADRNIAWHKFHLSRFFRSVPHRATKTTTYYELPSCKLVMNKATDKINKPSKDELEKILLRLAEEKDTEMIKTTVTEEVNWSKYKDNLDIVDGRVVDKRTGEVLDDVKITHVEPEFVLQFKKEDKKGTMKDENHGDSDSEG